MRRAVAVWRLQLVTNIPVQRERQALLRNGWPSDLAAQPLELLALIRPLRYTGVQGEPGYLADLFIDGLVTDRPATSVA